MSHPFGRGRYGRHRLRNRLHRHRSARSQQSAMNVCTGIIQGLRKCQVELRFRRARQSENNCANVTGVGTVLTVGARRVVLPRGSSNPACRSACRVSNSQPHERRVTSETGTRTSPNPALRSRTPPQGGRALRSPMANVSYGDRGQCWLEQCADFWVVEGDDGDIIGKVEDRGFALRQVHRTRVQRWRR